jgi:hypothetical protein
MSSKQSKKSKGLRAPRWMQHRALVAAEALALAGVAKYELTMYVKALPNFPNWGKVLFLLAATVGIFGIVFVAVERLLTRSVERSGDVVKALPLPAPIVLFHLSVGVALFYLYAWVYHLPVPPLR